VATWGDENAKVEKSLAKRHLEDLGADGILTKINIAYA
jgi:hypothetical protein